MIEQSNNNSTINTNINIIIYRQSWVKILLVLLLLLLFSNTIWMLINKYFNYIHKTIKQQQQQHAYWY